MRWWILRLVAKVVGLGVYAQTRRVRETPGVSVNVVSVLPASGGEVLAMVLAVDGDAAASIVTATYHALALREREAAKVVH